MTDTDLAALLHKRTWLTHGVPMEAECGYCQMVATHLAAQGVRVGDDGWCGDPEPHEPHDDEGTASGAYTVHTCPGVRVGDPPPPADDAGGLRAAAQAVEDWLCTAPFADTDLPRHQVERADVLRDGLQRALSAGASATAFSGASSTLVSDVVNGSPLAASGSAAQPAPPALDRERLARAVETQHRLFYEQPESYDSPLAIARAIADAYEADDA